MSFEDLYERTKKFNKQPKKSAFIMSSKKDKFRQNKMATRDRDLGRNRQRLSKYSVEYPVDELINVSLEEAVDDLVKPVDKLNVSLEEASDDLVKSVEPSYSLEKNAFEAVLKEALEENNLLL